jgi:hypothetical protein
MGEAGILAYDERVELLDGEIVTNRSQETCVRGQAIVPLAFPRLRFRVAELLG